MNCKEPGEVGISFFIRKAQPEDAHDYADCHISSWRSAYKGIIPDEYLNKMVLQKKQLAERFKLEINEENSCFYLPVYGNKAIGKLVIGKSRDEDKPKAGEIMAVYLLESFWDKGYGREMMDFSVNQLKNMGYNEIIIWVLDENKRARRFYEKYGCESDGAEKEIYVGKPLIEMRYVFKIT